MRIVHYLNQFQAGIGGEDAATDPPRRHDGAVGPGRLLSRLLGDDHEIVASVSCGDDRAASDASAIPAILDLVRTESPDLLVVGPAFSSGRYGFVTGRLLAAATDAGIPAVGAMHPDNPGVDSAGAAVLVRSGAVAAEMKAAMETLAAAAIKVGAGEPVTRDDGRIGAVPRRNTMADQRSATRAVDLALRRLLGDAGDDADAQATEIPAARHENIRPASAVEDISTATVALATEGGLVPFGNPDRLEAARVTRWLAYDVADLDSLIEGDWESVDGGFSTVDANADPNRIIPLDVSRDLERDGRFAFLHRDILVTTGNGTPVATSKGFGVEWAARLHQANVQAVVLSAT